MRDELREELEKNPLLNSKKSIDTIERILSKNDKEANRLREIWSENSIYVINLMSSPGSGKTTLLESIGKQKVLNFGVVEGDLETNRDAKRLQDIGIEAHQITTGNACHLEASMIRDALVSFELSKFDYLVIENVGNLVCPASYDLGAHLNIALLSVPEGDDKVLKYPTMFRAIDLLLITKTDLIEHFDYSIDRVKDDMNRLKPGCDILEISSKDEKSIEMVIDYIVKKREQNFCSNHIF